MNGILSVMEEHIIHKIPAASGSCTNGSSEKKLEPEGTATVIIPAKKPFLYHGYFNLYAHGP